MLLNIIKHVLIWLTSEATFNNVYPVNLIVKHTYCIIYIINNYIDLPSLQLSGVF